MKKISNLRRIFTFERVILQITNPPKIFFCNICGGRRLLIRTDKAVRVGSRCLSCHSTVHHRGMHLVLTKIFDRHLSKLSNSNIYEISAHGALYNYFKKNEKKLNYKLYYSEFLDGWLPGKTYNGVRCEDVQSLTFRDNFFKLITSTGLMEHVEDDQKSYKEIYRVLKHQGYYIFTVPLMVSNKKTIIRAIRDENNVVKNILEPEYHGDPFRGDKGVFTWRNYGTDIIEVLNSVGFEAYIDNVYVKEINDFMPVIVAKKN